MQFGEFSSSVIRIGRFFESIFMLAKIVNDSRRSKQLRCSIYIDSFVRRTLCKVGYYVGDKI